MRRYFSRDVDKLFPKLTRDNLPPTGRLDGGEIVYLTDEQIFVYYNAATHAWINLGSGTVNASQELYTNSNPIPEAIGGIEAGTVFTNISMSDMWDKLLYPYQAPSITSFYIQGVSSVKEVGSYLIGNTNATNLFKFSWAAVNENNIQNNTIRISDSTGTVYVNNSANDHYEEVSASDIKHNAPTVTTFIIQARNSKSDIIQRTQSYSWRWKCYWGTSTEESLTETGIKGLASSDLLTTYTGTRNYPAGGYKYFAIPEEFVQPSTFIDADGNFEVAMDEVYDLTITNDYGLTTTYKVYRTKNSLAGELNMLTN